MWIIRIQKKNKQIKKLWETTITSSGEKSDLREVFPILITEAMPFITTNTGKRIGLIISENDPRIQETISAAAAFTGKKLPEK